MFSHIEFATVLVFDPDYDQPNRLRCWRTIDNGRVSYWCAGRISHDFSELVARIQREWFADDSESILAEKDAERRYQYGLDYACGIYD